MWRERTGAMAEPEPAAMAAAGAEVEEEGGAGSSPGTGPPPPPSAAEYARRVHQWLWDSYCGYVSWHSGLPALMAAAAAAAGTAPCSAGPAAAAAAAAAYYSPFYVLPAPGPARLTPLPRPGPAAPPRASSAPRDSARPAGEPRLGWTGPPLRTSVSPQPSRSQ